MMATRKARVIGILPSPIPVRNSCTALGRFLEPHHVHELAQDLLDGNAFVKSRIHKRPHESSILEVVGQSSIPAPRALRHD